MLKDRQRKKRTSNQKENEPLEVGNVILCVLACTTRGSGLLGESYLHLIMYRLLDDKAFKDLRERYPFVLNEDRPVSRELHAAIGILSRDLFVGPEGRGVKFTPTVITDIEREDYTTVRNAESWMDQYVGEKVEPRIFILTPVGMSVASYTWQHMFTDEQRNVMNGVIAEILQ